MPFYITKNVHLNRACPGLRTIPRILSLILCMTAGTQVLGQGGLRINEALASNAGALLDEDGHSSDWIEIHNAGADSVHLAEYGLSDNPANPFKWRFPATAIPPGGYLLVWASGKDRRVPGAPLHTSYSISAAGETLVLTRPDGYTVDSLPAVLSRTNISYGRGEEWKAGLRFFLDPTPWAPNDSPSYLGILPEPTLELTLHEGLGYRLVCHHPDSEAEIRFRLDGGAPRQEGEIYTDTLYLSEVPPSRLMHIPTNPWEAHAGQFGWLPPGDDLPAGLVVRATAFRPGYIPSLPVTLTHLDLDAGLPVLLLSADSLDLFSDSTGIYVPGRIYQENGWNWNDPYGTHANYFQSGPEWERPAHIEFRMPDGQTHQQYIGLRIHGGGTRALPQKSLRLYARGGYGLDHFPLDLFGDGQTRHRRLILRNSGQDGVFRPTLLRDASIHQIMAPLQIGIQAYQPSLLFLNGEYWGIHNIRERMDAHYLALRYGVNPGELDILENNLVPEAGDYLHYLDLRTYLQTHDPAEEAVYQEITRRLDPESYIDHQIAHIFAANYDWPGNNVLYWRLRSDDYQPGAPYGHDGRWRWLFKDADMGFGLWDGIGYDLNMLIQATDENGPAWPNPDWSTFLFRSLLKNQRFQEAFILRFCDLLNTAFLPHRTRALISANAERLRPYLDLHMRRWQRPADLEEWESHLEGMLTFCDLRPVRQRQQLRAFFQLGDPTTVTLQVSDPGQGHIRLNTLSLRAGTAGVAGQPYPWTGAYFPDIPLTLEAIPAPGYRFSHWSGSAGDSNARITLLPGQAPVFLTAHFEPEGSVPGGLILHAWHFNDLPGGTLTEVPADHSLSAGGRIHYPGVGDGYMDRVNEGSLVNAEEGTPAGRALRVRNPSDTRELRIELPTSGYRPATFSYAVTRTNNGATSQSLWYSLTEEPEWQLLASGLSVTDTFRRVAFDLSGLEDAANNPWFALRFLFEGAEAAGSSGNNRFDNVRLTGDPVSTTFYPGDPNNRLWVQPHPLRGEGLLHLDLVHPGHLQINIYNHLGQPMPFHAEGYYPAGSHRLVLPARLWPPGLYICRLEQDGQAPVVMKMLIAE